MLELRAKLQAKTRKVGKGENAETHHMAARTINLTMGHSTPQITSDTYAHLSPAHLAGAADRVSFPTPAEPARVLPFQASGMGEAGGG